MKKLHPYMKRIGILMLGLFVLASCSKDDDNGTEKEKEEEKSDAKEIVSFNFLAADNDGLSEDVKGIIDRGARTIRAEVPAATDVKALRPTIVLSEKATVDPSEKTATDFSQTDTYTVTAEDGSTAKYTVNVIALGKSNAKEINSFVFLAADNESLSEDLEAIIDIEAKTVTATVPSRVGLTALSPSISVSSGASIDPRGKVATDFTEDVTYTVTAEDGSTADYTVTIALSERDALIAFKNANRNITWNTDTPISNWEGVGLNEEGKVKALSFPFSSRIDIVAIPPEIKYLINLEVISIVNASLRSLPKEIGKLKNLKSLTVASTNLNALPPEIGNLTSLIDLSVSQNRLKEIPSSIGNLSNLEILGLGSNSLSVIPAEIWNLEKLKSLFLNSNSLSVIPADIGDLENLETLLIFRNSLTSLPKEMGKLLKLKSLRIQDNQITTIPKEICDLNIPDFRQGSAICEQ